MEVIAKENKENDLFRLTYQFDFGKNLNPKIGLITSIDSDHLDIYGNFEEVRKSFKQLRVQK